ncbi:MAG: hypothetical protein NXY59_01255 [Aigarchaeota archaeon]|nr:hypothetical protein [Candidatus Pelearchaeum maunauluense]
MAGLMSQLVLAWITGLTVLILAYTFIYAFKPLSMVNKTIIASAGTGLTLSNLAHDLTVFLPHYTHSVITIIPAALIPVITAIIIFEIKTNEIPAPSTEIITRQRSIFIRSNKETISNDA